MLIHLKQHVNKRLIILSAFSLFAVAVSAKQIPITQEAEIVVPVGQFSVVEFPFEISGKNITTFMTKIKVIKEKKVDSVDNLNDDLLNSGANTTESKKKTVESKGKGLKNISIVQNVNSFTFFPKKEGVLKMVVWGYDHPILLTIKAESKNGFGLYQFVQPLSKSSIVAETEQGSHEELVNMLMVHLFNQTLPKGYKSSSKDVFHSSNGFEIRLNREVFGKKYLGQEWILTNVSNANQKLHEESFYENGVYGVSLEDNKVDKSESVRVFIVRSNFEAK